MSSSPEPPHARTTAPTQSLARLLESTDFSRAVPYLAAETLHRVIEHCGLEACGSVVAAATRQQLTVLLDLDLWRAPQAGHEPLFDVQRFAEWIDTLVENDLTQAAQIVTRMPPPVVVAGMAGHLRIFEVAIFEPPAANDDEPWEPAAPNQDHLETDIGGYRVRSRHRDYPDALIAVLTELAATDTPFFHTVMRGCCRLSDAGHELDGLDALADASTQLLDAAAWARDDRRLERGYLSASDARAFLALARHGAGPGLRLVVDEYKRNADLAVAGRADPSAVDTATASTPATGARAVAAARDESGAATEPGATAAAVRGVVDELAAAGLMAGAPRTLLTGATGGEAPSRLSVLLEYVQSADESLFLARGEELTFLANALMTGCAVQKRALTTQEAADAAAAVCNLGLECWPVTPADAHLVDHDLISAFGVGWTVLHRDVSVFVAKALLAVLDGLTRRDAVTNAGLRALRRALTTHLRADAPWLASEALDILSSLDTPSWCGLLGLLSECPVLPDIVPAIVERRTARVSPSAFAFIATPTQIETVRHFMARLPELLAS